MLTLRLDPDKYQFVATWLAGSIWGTSWKFVLSLLPWILILLPYVIYKARVMNVLLVLTADTMGRRILQPSEIPADIVVAVIGAPYFLYLLARTKS
ncbi:Iron-uptake system permease protein FeuC [compost metagenome]